jgi:pimeloyl-ACP methyl ester carboxylesterase
VTRLVLLPGLDGTGDLFAPFTSALGDVPSQVVEYPPDRAMSYAELEAYATAKLPGDEDFVLLAESFSGPVGIAIAASRPPRLRGLILSTSFASNPLPLFGPLAGIIAAMPAGKIPPALTAAWLYAGYATPELRRAHAAAMARVPARVINARVAAVLEVDNRALLERIAVPILYMRAKADRLMPVSAGRDILERRPDTELVELDGPHFLLQCKPAASAAVVMKFLAHCAR